MFSLFLFNVFIICLMAFLTSWLLIEFVLLIFRIRSPRLKAFYRMIPIIKLPLDIFFFNWNNWAINQNVYPWLCEKNSRTLSIGFKIPNNLYTFLFPQIDITLRTKEQFHFSIVDYVFGIIEPKAVNFFIISFLLLCIFSIAIKLAKLYRAQVEVRKILKNSKKIKLNISNSKISQFLQKHKILLLENFQYSGSPFVTGFLKKKIVFSSEGLKQYSKAEIEATLAHEISHIQAKDILCKHLITYISLIFCWIPIKKLSKCIYFNQEIACDQKALCFKVEKTHLATAIQKLAKLHYKKQTYQNQLYFVESTKITNRVLALSKKKHFYKNVYQYVLGTISAYFIVGILFGKFWMN